MKSKTLTLIVAIWAVYITGCASCIDFGKEDYYLHVVNGTQDEITVIDKKTEISVKIGSNRCFHAPERFVALLNERKVLYEMPYHSYISGFSAPSIAGHSLSPPPLLIAPDWKIYVVDSEHWQPQGFPLCGTDVSQ